MKNKTAIILGLIGLILIIGGGALAVVKGFNGEKENLSKTMNIIVDDYSAFKTKIENFSSLREEIYTDIMNSQYYSEVFEKYNANIEKLTSYEGAVVQIDNVSSNLKKNCTSRKYNDQDITNKCNAFIINYEQSINYFINDINRFNTRIEEYNKWVTTENTNKKYTELEKFKSRYTDYVDINNDKISSGKAEK